MPSFRFTASSFIVEEAFRMSISILQRVVGALLLAALLLGCDVVPSAPNATANPAAQPTAVMTSEPAPGGATAYPAPDSTTENPALGPGTAYPAPETVPTTGYPAPAPGTAYPAPTTSP